MSLLTKPWRKFHKENDPWTSKVYESLKGEVVTHELLKEANMEYFNVLLIGQISSGKSSFVNTVESVFEEYVTMKANVGQAEASLTTKYRTYKIRSRDKANKVIKLKFCDTMGLEGGDVGVKLVDLNKIMDGNVKDNAFLGQGGIHPGDLGYNSSPTIGDKIHCVVFVVDASKFDVMDETFIKKVQELRQDANRRSLNPFIILTRIDQVCDDTLEDVTKVFHSSIIKEKVRRVSMKFGIPENMVYPIKNYCDEIEKEVGIDILALVILRQIVRSSKQFLEDKIDQEEERKREAKLTLGL